MVNEKIASKLLIYVLYSISPPTDFAVLIWEIMYAEPCPVLSADPVHSPLLHLLYKQFLGYPAAYPPENSVPWKFARLSGISIILQEDKSFVQK